MTCAAAFCVAQVSHFTTAPQSHGGNTARPAVVFTRCRPSPFRLDEYPLSHSLIGHSFCHSFSGRGARCAAGGSASGCAAAEVISAGKMVRAARRRGALRVFGLLRDGGNWGRSSPASLQGPCPSPLEIYLLNGGGFLRPEEDYDRFRDLLPSLLGMLRFRKVGGPKAHVGFIARSMLIWCQTSAGHAFGWKSSSETGTFLSLGHTAREEGRFSPSLGSGLPSPGTPRAGINW